MNVFEIIRNKYFFSGNGVYSNVEISNKNMLEFLEKNKKLFSDSVKTHFKMINFDKTPK